MAISADYTRCELAAIDHPGPDLWNPSFAIEEVVVVSWINVGSWQLSTVCALPPRPSMNGRDEEGELEGDLWLLKRKG
jgi:hypothetical protein